MTVEDFGKGIMSSVRLPASSETRIELNDVLGLGLKGVRERLRQLGGRFHIHSASSGTIVTARVPLAAI
jgi:signal transduction histidine kinase